MVDDDNDDDMRVPLLLLVLVAVFVIPTGILPKGGNVHVDMVPNRNPQGTGDMGRDKYPPIHETTQVNGTGISINANKRMLLSTNGNIYKSVYGKR